MSFLKTGFFEFFVPGVTKYLKESGLPIKAVLLIDNAPSHPAANVLVSGDITVKFLSPNVTALVQPMDQGVLENIKRVYRWQMLSQLIEDEEEHGAVEILKSFNVKTVIYMVAESWEQVARSTLIKSWKKLWPSVCDLPENEIKPVGEKSVKEKDSNEVQPQEFMDVSED